MKRLEQMTFWERIYLPEVLRGLVVTGYRFWRKPRPQPGPPGRAVQRPALDGHRAVSRRAPSAMVITTEEAAASRSRRTARCVVRRAFSARRPVPRSAFTSRPPRARIPRWKKYPARYEIDTLRCIYCGYCVEACPCDAIRMDTNVRPRIWGYSRLDFIETEEVLMERSRVIAERGRDALIDDMLKKLSIVGACGLGAAFPSPAHRSSAVPGRREAQVLLRRHV